MVEIPKASLSRELRIADQSCTAHAALRDRYEMRSLILDLSILLLSAWLTAMVFVQPAIALSLTPGDIDKDLWIGLLSIGTFGLSLVQLQVNWKGRAQAHQLASSALSSFVMEYRGLREQGALDAVQLARQKYQLLSDSLPPIPEAQFLRLKQRHRMKLIVSRHLDSHPGASIMLTYLVAWLRDNRRTMSATFDEQR